MTHLDRRTRRLIDSHFAAGLSPRGERRMRAALLGSPPARAYYRRHLALAALDPAGPTARDRIACGLGLTHRGSRATWATATLAVAALALAVLVGRGAVTADAPSGLRSRDDGASRSELMAYTIDAGGAVPLGDRITADTELVFAYRNGSNKHHLLVFAVDSTGSVHWYHPAWRVGRAPPVALPIEPGPALRELGHAIRHPLAPGPLHLYAVFADAPVDVVAVENMLRSTAPPSPIPFTDAVQQVRTLEVIP